MPSRLLAYIVVVVSLVLLTAAHSRAQRRNVGTDTTAPREQGSSSTEYDGQLNFDGTLLSTMNMSDWNSNKMVKREAERAFKTVRLSPSQKLANTWEGIISIHQREHFTVVFATGIGNTWAHASKFHVEGLSSKSSFEAAISGKVYEVPVTVAGIEVKMDIGRVRRVHPRHDYAVGVSGVLGLGIRSGPYFDARPFYELAIEQNRVKKPQVFACDFEKDVPEFHFGGVDEDRIGETEPEWHPLVPFLESVEWAISKGNIDIGNDKDVLQGIVTLFDTGTPMMFVPATAVAKIQQHIPGSLWYEPGREFLVPCDGMPRISFRWGTGEPRELKHNMFISGRVEDGHLIYKERKESMCHTAITIRREEHWDINPAFLKNMYTIFDWGEKRIGLGKVIKKS